MNQYHGACYYESDANIWVRGVATIARLSYSEARTEAHMRRMGRHMGLHMRVLVLVFTFWPPERLRRVPWR